MHPRHVLRSVALLAPLLSGCILQLEVDTAPVSPGASSGASSGFQPKVVIAHVDTGINPYHVAFRDFSPLARVHPSEYIPGFPADAPALPLSLDAPDLATALLLDQGVWDSVEPGTLYWIPGTRIVAAISFGAGGTRCPVVDVPPVNLVSTGCSERVILDDHGHGTMTASRMVGGEHSLCPACRIVSAEGAGAKAVRWLADLGWVDVQTNSWLGFVPPPLSSRVDGISDAFAYAAQRMVTFAASGNGAGYVMGFAPTPTYVLDTAPPGVILVGAHDNGFVAGWSGAPAHLVADGYGGWTARHESLDAVEPHPVACCTSAASPYAAGGAAAILLQARQILGDEGTGLRGKDVAVGTQPFGLEGPLEDGALSLQELRRLLLVTANVPVEGPDDGLVHWGARGVPDPANPAGNPYCLGCWTSPIKASSLPHEALVAHAGYGAVDPDSVAHADQVLRGREQQPSRFTEDLFFAGDEAIRRAVFGLG